MKNFIKHLSVWIFAVFAGIVSVYVSAQVSSVSIEANIGSFVQYIGSLFVTSDGTPSGQPIVSIDDNGLSLHDLMRENAGPGLIGVNTAGQVVITRPLSYVTLPATSTVQQLENNHAYIVPYWDEGREATYVQLPDVCIVGDQIEVYAMQLPLDIVTMGDMKIVAPYLEGDSAGYGYGNPIFVEYDGYLVSDGLGYNEYCDSGVGPNYPYDWCSYVWDEQGGSYSYGTGESPWGYGETKFPPREISFLCIQEHKYLMQQMPMGLNTPGDGFFYDIGSGYGDEHGIGSPNPFDI